MPVISSLPTLRSVRLRPIKAFCFCQPTLPHVVTFLQKDKRSVGTMHKYTYIPLLCATAVRTQYLTDHACRFRLYRDVIRLAPYVVVP